jgi:predicted ATP-grasp superfamily ATP-dependent carboligase
MSQSTHIEIPVVVVGSWTTALSVIRLASKVCDSVYAACPIGSWPCQTKYYRELEISNGDIWRGELGESGYSYIRQLPFDRCVLIPAADDAALWLARLPKDLSSRFFVSSSSFESLEMLQDKSRFLQLIDQLDVPAPRSFSIKNASDMTDIPFGDLEAIFLKPTDSQAFVREYNKKAIWVDSKEQALAEWNRISSVGLSTIAQEYVSGGSDDHYFIDGFRDRDGNVRAVTARRRIRIYPIDFGNSSYCCSVPLNEVEQAWEALESLLEHVEYRGIFHMMVYSKFLKSILGRGFTLNSRMFVE